MDTGGNGLVDFYASLLEELCRASTKFNGGESSAVDWVKRANLLSSSKFLESLTNLFNSTDNSTSPLEGDVIAHAVPTFHLPRHSNPPFPSDVQVIHNLIKQHIQLTNQNVESTTTPTRMSPEVRISSAYLNPTNDMLGSLLQLAKKSPSDSPAVHFLSAGLESHGFAPRTGECSVYGSLVM
jgi:hypothetical protein